MIDNTTIAPGCYLDNHRGHYITRDAIELAIGYGFIVDGFARFALDMYDNLGAVIADDEYPFDDLVSLCDSAESWLNSGQGSCGGCGGKGYIDGLEIPGGVDTCCDCIGTGRGPREAGQNFPPMIPDGYSWRFWDGDFGVYADSED